MFSNAVTVIMSKEIAAYYAILIVLRALDKPNIVLLASKMGHFHTYTTVYVLINVEFFNTKIKFKRLVLNVKLHASLVQTVPLLAHHAKHNTIFTKIYVCEVVLQIFILGIQQLGIVTSVMIIAILANIIQQLVKLANQE